MWHVAAAPKTPAMHTEGEEEKPPLRLSPALLDPLRPRSGNDASPSVEQLRRIDAVVRRNRERLSGSAGTGDGGGGATQLEGGSVELGALGVRDRFRTYHES